MRLPGFVRLRPATTPGRLRRAAAAALAAVGLLFAAAAVGTEHAREGFAVIGHGAGAKVAASGDLYYALSDMDAQTATMLLVWQRSEEDAERARQAYDARRDEAGRAVVQAAQLAEGDPAEERNVREVVRGLVAYQRLVTEARVLAQQDAAPDPPEETVELYREATDLMRLELLPKAYNLTLDSGATVRATYEDKRASVLLWAGLTGGAGLLAVAALLWTHHEAAARFRRILNPALAAAVAGAAVLTVAAAGVLVLQAERMRQAKEEGLDPLLALSRVRAVCTGMNGDQSRFLLDGEGADTYEQVYLQNARSLLYVEGDDLADYYDGVDRAVGAYPEGEDMLGILGREAAELADQGRTTEVDDVLQAYRAFTQADWELRRTAAEDGTGAAVQARVGEVQSAYEEFDAAVVELKDTHGRNYEQAVEAGDRGLAGWDWGLPAAAAVLAVLVAAGIYPRLAEYR
ncbi:hypothetical protein [Nocardiopsis chromatogenes]|uniref:hypothetical protein n=1 Tax=Nocardiopsis chromatogenes TaxID=280239 RepID=UPI000349FAB3|nr:hypothetical protein [Nocardiopsis chromatogenes]